MTKIIFLFLALAVISCQNTPPTMPPQPDGLPTITEVVPDNHFCRSILVQDRRDRAVGVFGKYWPSGATIKIKFLNGDANQRRYFTDAILEWQKHINLKVSYVTTGNADIRVGFYSGEGSWSYVGTDAKKETGQANPTLNIGWPGSDVCLHEIGHAFGMAHEQASYTNDIQWNKDAVYKALGGPPNNWDKATIEWNVFRKMTAAEANATKFDHASIMQYSVPASWTFNYPEGIKGGKVLSDLDKSFMGSVYPKAVQPPAPPQAGTVTIQRWQRDSIVAWMSRTK